MKKIICVLIPFLFLLSGCGPIYKGTIVCEIAYDENYYNKSEWNYIDSDIVSSHTIFYAPLEWVDLNGKTFEEMVLYYKDLYSSVEGSYEFHVDENGILYEETYVDYTLTDRELLRKKGFQIGEYKVTLPYEKKGYTCEKKPYYDPDRI